MVSEDFLEGLEEWRGSHQLLSGKVRRNRHSWETGGNGVLEMCGWAVCAGCREHSRGAAHRLQGSEVSAEESRQGSRSMSQMPVLGLALKVGDSDLCGRGTGGDG